MQYLAVYGLMESYYRPADETANNAPRGSGSGAASSYSYTNDNIMFAAAINDDDEDEDDEEFRSVTTDSITSFAEWFFSGKNNREENDYRSDGSCGCGGGDGAASPADNSRSATGERNESEILRKRYAKKRLEAPQYNEFIQCAKSSMDIVSYVLDPLGDICHGKKLCFSTLDDDRKHNPVAHRDQTKQNHCPDMNYFAKEQRLEPKNRYSEMNFFATEPSLESLNECNTTSTTTSSKCCSINTPPVSHSPRGVDMTNVRAVETNTDLISDELNDCRLGISPLIQDRNLSYGDDHDDEGNNIVRKLFTSDEDDFAVSFGTNLYRENCSEKQHSKTISQMLIETNYLRSHFQYLDKPNNEVRSAPSPDPHAIYCCQPRQRMRLEEKKFRKAPSSVSDPHAIYCCPPRVRIRHEMAHDEINGNNTNSATPNHNKNLLEKSTTASADANINTSTVPATLITASTTTKRTMASGWSGDKFKAKMKRRAKMKDRLSSKANQLP